MGYSHMNPLNGSPRSNELHPSPPITEEKRDYFEQLKVTYDNHVVSSIEEGGTEKKSNEYVLVSMSRHIRIQ